MTLEGYDPTEVRAAEEASRIENTILHHDALRSGLKALRMHQARSLKLHDDRAQSSHLMIIAGVSGSGKSTLLKEHMRRFSRAPTEDGIMMPVVVVEMPSPCTRKGLVENIMAAMGHYPSANWNTNRIIEEIVNFARQHGVLTMALDEADRIFNSDQPVMAKFLVSLLNNLPCQLVLAGAPEVLQLNRGWGLERRKEADLLLNPYHWESAEGQAEFRALLGAFEVTMALPASSHLSSFDVARRLYVASLGHVGLVSKILVEAVRRVHLGNRTHISVDLLADVYADFRRNDDLNGSDVIDFDCDALLTPLEAPGLLSDDRNPFRCTEKRLRQLWTDHHRSSEAGGGPESTNRTTRARGSAKTGAH